MLQFLIDWILQSHFFIFWKVYICYIIKIECTSTYHLHIMIWQPLNQNTRYLSKHLKGRSGPASVTFLLMQRILLFLCFQTLSVFKGFWRFPVPRQQGKKSLLLKDFAISPVYRHLLDSKVSRNRNLKKKMPCSRDFVIFPVSRTFYWQKCQETWETTNKPLE